MGEISNGLVKIWRRNDVWGRQERRDSNITEKEVKFRSSKAGRWERHWRAQFWSSFKEIESSTRIYARKAIENLKKSSINFEIQNHPLQPSLPINQKKIPPKIFSLNHFPLSDFEKWSSCQSDHVNSISMIWSEKKDRKL